jgi:hypothetical protein
MKNNPWDDDENPEATIVMEREETNPAKAKDPTIRATIKTNGIPAPSKPNRSKRNIRGYFSWILHQARRNSSKYQSSS